MKIAFVTNICPHYRIRTFENLAKHYQVDYYFFSSDDEWYWLKQHGVHGGDFSYVYLPGIRIGRTRLTPTLPWKLWIKHYDVYIKCINGRFALPSTYLVTRLKRRPFILWTGIWHRLSTPFHRLAWPLTRYIYQHADAIVVYGEHVKRYLLQERVHAERIFVAPHAVDNEAYSRVVAEEEKDTLRAHLGISRFQKVILYLGRLEEVKGLSYLLEAFAALRRDDTVLVLAGDGTELHHLRQLSQRLSIADRVRFPGYVPQRKTIEYYALAWVCVLPSITTSYFKEPWGLIVNEAFNQGVPVVATDAVGAAAGGLVRDGVNGFIVAERDSKALADALQLVLDNPGLREQLGQTARQTIASWNNELMVQGFQQAIAYVTRQFGLRDDR